MRISLLLCLTLFFHYTNAKNPVKKVPTPVWVNPITSLDQDILEGNGSYQYLLIDLQEHVPLQTVYGHYAVKVLNAEGVQAMSDISITLDPAYQQLYFHEIKIIRDAKVIDKLKESTIHTYQRETSMERSLYDGSLSAVINLTDVRENDIIVYSYSLIGFNPIHKGHYATTYYLQHPIPVNRIYNRVLTHPDHDIQYKLYHEAPEPVVRHVDAYKEYLWDVKALDYLLYDTNVPAWFDPHRRVSISTFHHWQEVVDWALPLYRYSAKELEQIKQSLQDTHLKDNTLARMIRWVQDDVRYLGFESGIGAYKPNPPLKVFRQRYGDCKDKSLLLVALLQSEDIAAYPLLVNTQLKGELRNQLPSPTAFNHCVVYFNYQGKEYFVDPTLSHQGGSLEDMAFPNYQSGLLIKPGKAQLLTIPEKNTTAVAIKELITVDSIGGDAALMVRTEYKGSKADAIRSYFNTTSRESIQKEYLNFYSHLYADVALADEIKFYDYERNSSNTVIVEEYYQVKNFWLMAKDQAYLYCELYPLVLESQIGYAKTTEHAMPYYMGEPYTFTQTTQVDLPQDWPVRESTVRIVGDGFAYENRIQGYGKTVSITHYYQLSKEYITADSVAAMLSKHEDIQNELSYYLTYNQNLSGFTLSWISIMIATIAFGVGIFFAVKLYRNYDPEAWIYAENKSIGSWLILPAIGLTLSPILLLREIINAQHFNQHTWQNLFSSHGNQSVDVFFILSAEIIYNFLLLAFTLLVILVFYQRRTSTPRLITIYYLISFLGPLLDILLIEEWLPGQLQDSDKNATYREVGRSLIAAAIWIPYFNISERAKSTFCKRIKSSAH